MVQVQVDREPLTFIDRNRQDFHRQEQIYKQQIDEMVFVSSAF